MRLAAAFYLSSALCCVASTREVRIEPQVAYIHGAGGTHRLLVTAVDSDGTRRDITQEAKLSFDAPDVVETAPPGQVKALKEGITKVRAEFDGRTAESALVVQPRRTMDIDFVHD